MRYIALPTLAKDEKGRTKLAPPYDIFAVSSVTGQGSYKIGNPPYYRVIGIKDGVPVIEKLSVDSIDFNRVRKWAGVVPRSAISSRTAERKIFSFSNARCHVSGSDITRLLA
jgi:hypothetical protein